jgi:3-oxoacyl-[acyl-carrier-protein] synthase II
MTRVCITAAGVMTPIGTGMDEFDRGLHEASRGVGRIVSFDTSCFPTSLGGEARENGDVIHSASEVDRKAHFFKKAVLQLPVERITGCYAPADRVLHAGAGIDYFDLPGYVKNRDSGNWKRFNYRSHGIVEEIARELDIQGGHFVNVSACVASAQAMGLALRVVRNAPDKTAITGGYDSMLSHLHYMGFFSLGALSDWDGEPSASCRPFDRDRRGLVIGEGAAAFLLESEDRAGHGSILAEFAGYGSTMDAYMVTDPEPKGTQLARAMLEAIRDAGITPDDIDMVDMHGTGTIKNALAEAKALEIVFPKRYRDIPVFALKGQIGHLIGACAAVEVLGVIDALKHQRVLPSVNCDEPDPEIPLRIVKGEPLPMKIQHILKLNAAFGGQNSAMVFRKYES